MRLITTALMLLFPLLTNAQEVAFMSVNEDALAGTSMQLYFDFAPISLVLGVPPLTPAAEDILIVIHPLADNVTSNTFVTLISNELSDYVNKTGIDYRIRLRERQTKGEKGHDAIIKIDSPTSLEDIYASTDSLTPPTVEVTASPGISFNPFIGNSTQRLTGAFKGTSNAQLLVNGQNPNDDVTHQIEVFSPGNLKFSFLSGTNPFQPVTFLLSPFYSPENIPAAFVSFPGSLDLGTFSGGTFQNVNVVADANFGGTGDFLDLFFVTNSQGVLDFQVSTGLSAVGGHIAAQAVIADPTLAPVGLSFTQAADLHFSLGSETNFSLSDNGSAPVPFIQGTTFDFFGTTYSSLTVSANGYVSFGGPLGVLGDTSVDPLAALAANPAIFANWADWDTTGVGVNVRQFGAELRINWGDTDTPISHTNGSGTDVGAFSLTLHLTVPTVIVPPNQSEADDRGMSIASAAGSIFIDTSLLDDGDLVQSFDALVGISPGGVGMPALVPNRTFDFPRFPMVANAPFLAQFNAAGLALSTLGAATGTAPLYNNGRTIANRTISFFPSDILGQTGYKTISDGHPLTDLQGADVATLSIGTNQLLPLSFNLIGYFRYLFTFSPVQPLPLIELVDAATQAPIAVLNFVNLMTPNGAPDAGTLVAAPTTVPIANGYRAFEGAGVQLPTGALAGQNIGATTRIRITLPTGNILLSRGTILLN